MVTRRVEALTAFITSEDGKNLLAGTKRAVQLLAAEEKKGTVVADGVADESPEARCGEGSSGLPSRPLPRKPRRPIAEEDFRLGHGEALSKLRAPVDKASSKTCWSTTKTRRSAPIVWRSCRPIREATGTVADFSKISG